MNDFQNKTVAHLNIESSFLITNFDMSTDPFLPQMVIKSNGKKRK